ncbi:MAG: lipid-A-disaccharide synthase, partial [Leptospiraceae bacterium]|nr:lipid-A-disaccharide synthase [Leptospiraceae bacterium]
NLNFFGIGGELMIKNGLNSLEDMEDLAVIGFTAALFKYRKLKGIAKKLVQKVGELNCKYIILVDYPGFNLALAKMLREKYKDIKVIFYVSPQIWAWRYKRIFKIKKLVDLMLLLFPFEKEIYDKHEIPNVVVGHPLVNQIKEKFESGKEITFPEGTDEIICLMPGSRSGEIRRLFIPLLDSAVILFNEYKKKNKNIIFLVPGISSKEESYILDNINLYKTNNPGLHISYEFQNSAKCIEKSKLVLLASGTATLEVAYFKKPMVIIYKGNPMSFYLGMKLLDIPYVGLVNILSRKFICKELLQKDCTPEKITDEALLLLNDNNYYNEMVENLSTVKDGLGKGDSSILAAEAILKLISFG